jgi:hypothetical protein
MSLFPQITKARVEQLKNAEGAHRISFATCHKDQPKRSDEPFIGTLNLPFSNKALEADLNLQLFRNPNYLGVWRSIRTNEEYGHIVDWIKKQGTRVFLRDCLDSSIALDFYFDDAMRRTPIGELEFACKECENLDAQAKLIDCFVKTIRSLSRYREARFISAVPPRTGKLYDLPSRIAEGVAAKLGLENLTASFAYSNIKPAIKALDVDQKWDALTNADLKFGARLSDFPSVILVDDKYQSGMTLQFVASILRAEGAGEILGLCAVKTMRDDDNQT